MKKTIALSEIKIGDTFLNKDGDKCLVGSVELTKSKKSVKYTYTNLNKNYKWKQTEKATKEVNIIN